MKHEVIIIDVREVDAYKGWRLHNEKRGGHIKGAKSLSVKWVKYIDWIEIVRSKEILPQHDIVLDGYSKEQTDKIAKRLTKADYSRIIVYNHFINEWTANSEFLMNFIPRFENLVPASWVNEIISENTP